MWEREQRHEALRWEREDQARTFEQRRDAYINFYAALKRMVETASERAHGVNPRELPPGFGFAVGEQLELIDLYGTGAVPAAALVAFQRASALGHNGPRPGFDEEVMEFEYDEAELELLNAIRADLGVPGLFVAITPEQPDRRVLKS
ncbi:hypothetical protein [Actinoplanes sp. NPDC049681]|uniref:hypothetical protein n=1 Tax=Actinoplanes sp. NPDC049681 TaxID=3363905 RepID=UPI0037B3E4B2